MKIFATITGILFVLMLMIAGVCGVSYISASNYGATAEAGLEAAWTNNQNILGNYTLKIKEMAQVPDMYADDLKSVLAAELSARYGSDGSKATMQWIKEHAVNFDSSLYTSLQQTMSAGRDEFTVAQTRMIDEKRQYTMNLNFFWRGFWLKLAGYPKVNLEKYKPVVASDTARAFETGVAEPVKLR